jgi:hypothetical protein
VWSLLAYEIRRAAGDTHTKTILVVTLIRYVNTGLPIHHDPFMSPLMSWRHSDGDGSGGGRTDVHIPWMVAGIFGHGGSVVAGLGLGSGGEVLLVLC